MTKSSSPSRLFETRLAHVSSAIHCARNVLPDEASRPATTLDPSVHVIWSILSGSSAVALAVLLLVRHIFEGPIDDRARRIIDLSTVPLAIAFLSYVVVRPFV